jgi:type I restriction enzyme S subunit
MMRMWQGAVGVAPVEGLVSPAYVVAHPFPETEARYFNYLFHTNVYMNEVDKYSHGIVKYRNRLYWDEFKQIPSVFPPTDEQKTIANFLDANARMTRQLVRAKRRLIELLNEQKQGIIHEAVTCGLDSNVRLRPSGIDWLGDVPEHWEIKKLRDIAQLLVSNVDKHTIDDEIPIRLCNYTDAYKNEFISSAIAFVAASATAAEIKKFRIRIGDVLITKDSELWNDIGVPSFVNFEELDLVCGYHLAMLRPRIDWIHGTFLHRSLQDRIIATQFHVAAKGVTRFGLSQQSIKDVLLPVPPADEQLAIVETLANQLRSISVALLSAQREIDLLREYRIRLIADVVTGKLDVRGVALPTLDETEDLDDCDIGEDFEAEEIDDSEEAEMVAHEDEA